MFKKILACVLSGLLVWGGLVSTAAAAIIDTNDMILMETRQSRVDHLQAELAREDVQQAMTKLGVDPVQAQQRVDSLSDEELVMLEQQLDTLPAGGSFFAVVGVVFVILLILELVGVTNIFTKA